MGSWSSEHSLELVSSFRRPEEKTRRRSESDRCLSSLFFQAGAMTIPSAIRIIIETYRDPSEQARALNIFGLSGALGNGEPKSSSDDDASKTLADLLHSFILPQVLGLVIAVSVNSNSEKARVLEDPSPFRKSKPLPPFFIPALTSFSLQGVLMLASWRWIFRFFSILLMPGTFLGFWLIPKRAPHIRAEKDAEAQAEPKWRRMDGLGCALMLCSSSLLPYFHPRHDADSSVFPYSDFDHVHPRLDERKHQRECDNGTTTFQELDGPFF